MDCYQFRETSIFHLKDSITWLQLCDGFHKIVNSSGVPQQRVASSQSEVRSQKSEDSRFSSKTTLRDGAKRTRTADFHNAIVTLYQLSYSPLFTI